MERLLKIANDMDDEAQRESLVGQRCFRVTDHIGEAPERGDGVPFRRSANLLIALGVRYSDELPRIGRLLPERTGVRAHEVWPVGGLRHRFRAEAGYNALARLW